MTEGNELIGWGMASGIWEAMQVEASAKAYIDGLNQLARRRGTASRAAM